MKKNGKKEHGFKVTSDGRLVIREDEEEDGKDKGTRVEEGRGELGSSVTRVVGFL